MPPPPPSGVSDSRSSSIIVESIGGCWNQTVGSYVSLRMEHPSPMDNGVRLVLFGAALGPLLLTMVLLILT